MIVAGDTLVKLRSLTITASARKARDRWDLLDTRGLAYTVTRTRRRPPRHGFAESGVFEAKRNRFPWVACCLLLLVAASPASAQQDVAIGPHGAINLDQGHPHIGFDVLVHVSQIAPDVRFGIWPNYAHVFIEDGRDVELISCDFPFEFDIDGTIITPYAAPGAAISISGDADFRINLIGGMFFEASAEVRPFTHLAIRLVDGVWVDLVAGVLFVL